MHEMDGCQCMILKEVNVFVSLIICPIVNNLKEEEKNIMVCKFKNYFSEKKLPLIENLKLKSLTCFHHQIDIIVACPKEISS